MLETHLLYGFQGLGPQVGSRTLWGGKRKGGTSPSSGQKATPLPVSIASLSLPSTIPAS